MDLGIADRTALVTGGTKGIGLAVAERLLRAGAAVTVCGRDPAGLENARQRLSQFGAATAIAADVRRKTDIDELVDAAAESMGSVDILVNNAGGITNFGGYEDLEPSDWVEAFELNLMSAVYASSAVVPGMRERGWGRIVNIATESALQPDAFFPHYAAQKAALLSVTKSLSKSLAGSGVLVNAVSPAFIMTPIIEKMLSDIAAQQGVDVAQAQQDFLSRERPNITLRRAGRADEVAQMVAVLCSEVASFVNGSNVRVDAGSVASIG